MGMVVESGLGRRVLCRGPAQQKTAALSCRGRAKERRKQGAEPLPPPARPTERLRGRATPRRRWLRPSKGSSRFASLATRAPDAFRNDGRRRRAAGRGPPKRSGLGRPSDDEPGPPADEPLLVPRRADGRRRHDDPAEGGPAAKSRRAAARARRDVLRRDAPPVGRLIYSRVNVLHASLRCILSKTTKGHEGRRRDLLRLRVYSW